MRWIGILVPPAFSDPMEVSAANLWAYCTSEEPRNLDALAAALEDFYSRPDYWKAKAKAGRRKVLEKYTSAQAAAHPRRVFDGLAYSQYGR